MAGASDPSRSTVFRYSRWDALSVAVIPLQVVFYVALAHAYRDLSPTTLVALVPVLFALSLQNAGANHNHYHTPFFRLRWLNALTRMGFSLTGAPKTPFNLAHGLHHATQKSWNHDSILEILGLKRPIHHQLLGIVLFVFESFGLKYLAFLMLLKRWPPERVAALAAPKELELATRLFRKVQEPATLRAVKLDLAAWLAFRLVLCAIDWRFFLFYFIPTSYLIEMLRQGENYFQHWGATDPDDPKRDSVSCYGALYNLLTFNLGYHQEHHLRPGVHWLELPRISAELPADRRSVPLTHYVNVPLFFPALAAGLAKKQAHGKELRLDA